MEINFKGMSSEQAFIVADMNYRLKKFRSVLKHILEEQLSHGEHGDAEYIRMITEALEGDE